MDDTLIKKAICWSHGKTDYTLRLSKIALSNLRINGASTVSGYPPVRKDRLIEIAITRYETDENIAEVAACLYNSDRDGQFADINPDACLFRAIYDFKKALFTVISAGISTSTV